MKISVRSQKTSLVPLFVLEDKVTKVLEYVEDILEACTDQLSRPAVNLYIRFTIYAYPANPIKTHCFHLKLLHSLLRQLRARERSPPPADDGFFSFLPRFEGIHFSWEQVLFLGTTPIACYFCH